VSAFFSVSTGLLMRDLGKPGMLQLYRLAGDSRLEPHKADRFYLSQLDDWSEVSSEPWESTLEQCAASYWTIRARAHSNQLLAGLNTAMSMRALESVDRILQTRVSPDALLDALLVAPLRDTDQVERLARLAASIGCASISALFDEVGDLQPLLCRLSEAWLSLPLSAWLTIDSGKQDVWVRAVETGIIRRCLEAERAAQFRSIWNELQFDSSVVSSPSARVAFAESVQSLTAALFPKETRSSLPDSVPEDDLHYEREATVRGQDTRSSFESFQAALRQVDGIAISVSRGKDNAARKYRRELVDRQLSIAGGAERAVKSLCNLAQRCADMFRTDFERECLDEALRLKPNDAWTIRQLEDHLKRIGLFDEAITTYEKSIGLEDELVARRGIADVYASRGELRKSIDLYMAIPGSEDMPIVRTAIADNLRRLGALDEAERAYRLIEQDFGTSDRLIGGMADIERRRGRLTLALQMYNEMLSTEEADARTAAIFMLQKAAILTQLGKPDEAYEITDAIVQSLPFFMQARVARATALALTGNTVQALADLPGGTEQTAFGDWIRYFYRGLLLLRLERFDEARTALMKQLSDALAQDDAQTMARLGAALVFLSDRDVSGAESMLGTIGEVGDLYRNYVAQVFWLHCATLRGDRDRAAALARELSAVTRASKEFTEALSAIETEDWPLARITEVRLLLGMTPDWSAVA